MVVFIYERNQMFPDSYTKFKIEDNKLQSNLLTTTTLGTQNLWPLLTGGRYLEVIYVIKGLVGTSKLHRQVIAIRRWSLAQV
jgi:hypothetical protein